MIEGFPKLFMTTGPNDPVALANIVRISERDVDWIANAITHMADQRYGTIEPTEMAEDVRMELVFQLA